MQVLLLGGHKDRESLLPGLPDQIKSTLCILPGDIDGNMHQIAFQLNSPEDIRRGFYVEATRTPSRTYGGRTQLHNYDEQQIWIHKNDIIQMYVNHRWPVDVWEHKNQAIKDSVGCPYRWPRTNMGLGHSGFRPQDAILQNPLVDVWKHHMRRDDNDACGAIPRTQDEWPMLSEDEIRRERDMPRVEKVPDAGQMARIWNYVPPRAGRTRFQESRHQASQSSGSQPSRALQPREQKHWRRHQNTNAGWGGSSSSGQRPPQDSSSSSNPRWLQY